MRKIYVLLTMSVFLMAGCGGGGGGGGTGTTTNTGGTGTNTTARPTIAKVTLATQGTLATGNALIGVAVTIQLPPEVTPATDVNGKVLDNVVTGSGVLANKASLYEPTYTPASDTTPGVLSFVIYDSVDNFNIGTFATVTLNIAPINFATINLNPVVDITSTVVNGFKVVSSSPRLQNGAEANGISIKLTAEAL